MSGTIKVVKGRIREAFGALTGNKRVQTKGKAQQSVGKVEKSAKKGVEKVRKSAKENIAEAKKDAEITVENAQNAKLQK